MESENFILKFRNKGCVNHIHDPDVIIKAIDDFSVSVLLCTNRLIITCHLNGHLKTIHLSPSMKCCCKCVYLTYIMITHHRSRVCCFSGISFTWTFNHSRKWVAGEDIHNTLLWSSIHGSDRILLKCCLMSKLEGNTE